MERHHEQAVADFDAVIRIAPWSSSAHLDRGIARVMLGQHDEARKDFERSLTFLSLPFNRDPRGISAARCGLGQVAHRLGQDELARVRNETIGFVFQAFQLLPRTSAVDNVAMPLVYRGVRRPERRRRAEEAQRALHVAQIRAEENARLERGLLPSPLLADTRLSVSARRLTQARVQAADRLSSAVDEVLPELGMADGHLHVVLAQLPAVGPSGAEDVTFCVSLNLGHDARPLARVASGGEL